MFLYTTHGNSKFHMVQYLGTKVCRLNLRLQPKLLALQKKETREELDTGSWFECKKRISAAPREWEIGTYFSVIASDEAVDTPPLARGQAGRLSAYLTTSLPTLQKHSTELLDEQTSL